MQDTESSPIESLHPELLSRIFELVSELPCQAVTLDEAPIAWSPTPMCAWKEHRNSMSPRPILTIQNSALVSKRWFEVVKNNKDLWVLAYRVDILCRDASSLAEGQHVLKKFGDALIKAKECRLAIFIHSELAPLRLPGTRRRWSPDLNVYIETILLFLEAVHALFPHKSKMASLSIVAFTRDLGEFLSHLQSEFCIGCPKLQWLSVKGTSARPSLSENFLQSDRFNPFRPVEPVRPDVGHSTHIRTMEVEGVTWPSSLQLVSAVRLRELRLQNWSSEQHPVEWTSLHELLRLSPVLAMADIDISFAGGLPIPFTDEVNVLPSVKCLVLTAGPAALFTFLDAFSFPALHDFKISLVRHGQQSGPFCNYPEPRRTFPTVKRFSYTSTSIHGRDLLAAFSFPAVDHLELLDDTFCGPSVDRETFPLPYGIELAPKSVVFNCLEMTVAAFHLAMVNSTRLEKVRLNCSDSVDKGRPLGGVDVFPTWQDPIIELRPALLVLKELTVSNCSLGKLHQWLDYFDIPSLQIFRVINCSPSITAHLAGDRATGSQDQFQIERLELHLSYSAKMDVRSFKCFNTRTYHDVSEFFAHLTFPDSEVSEENMARTFRTIIEELASTGGGMNWSGRPPNETEEGTLTYFDRLVAVRLFCKELSSVSADCQALLREVVKKTATKRSRLRSPLQNVSLVHGGGELSLL